MAKFLTILAASVGGGVVLGASIRLGEVLGSSAAVSRAPAPERRPANGSAASGEVRQTHFSQTQSADPLVIARLERLEEKLAQANFSRVAEPPIPVSGEPEWQKALTEIVVRIDRQQADVDSVRQQMLKARLAMDSVNATAEELRGELHRAISQDLDHRLRSIEEGFRVNMEAANRETVDAMVASIETRIAPRINRLEADVEGQKSAVLELRECALQSERSIQRLLGVLEKVMNPAGHATGHDLPGADATNTAAVRGKAPDDAAGGSGELRRAFSFRPLNPVI